MSDNQKHVDGHAYFIRKPIDYLEVLKGTLSMHHNLYNQPKPYHIVQTIELSKNKFFEFANYGMMRDKDFLKENTAKCHVNEHGICQVIRVVNESNPDESLLINTEGYNYARYTAMEIYYPEILKEDIRYMTAYSKAFIPKSNHWYEGRVDGYKVYAKVYPKPSEYGIDNGRISKLTILDSENNTIANYDRGWDVMPKAEYMEILEKAIITLEHIKPKQKSRNQDR